MKPRKRLSRAPPLIAVGGREENHGDEARSATRTAEPGSEHCEGKVATARGYERQHVEIISPGAFANGLQAFTLAIGTARLEAPSEAESFANCLDHGAEII